MTKLTVAEWCEKTGVSPDAVRMAFAKVGLTNFAKNRELSAAEVARLDSFPFRSRKTVSSKQPTAKRIVVLPKEQPGSGEAARPSSDKPAFKWPDLTQVYRFTVSALLIAVVVCHAGLVWYDCAHLYGWAGVIGGMAVFLIVLAAVMLSANREAYGTSEAALWFVFVVDAAAWWVHFPVFQTPDVSDTVTGALCAFICGTSWVALYLFRNFNIEQ